MAGRAPRLRRGRPRHQRQRLGLRRDPRGRRADGQGPHQEQGPLRMVGRRGGGPHRLDGLRGRPQPGGAGQDRALPELRHGRFAELHLLRSTTATTPTRVGAGPGPDGSAAIEKTFETFFTSVGEPFKGTDFTRSLRLRPVHRQRHPVRWPVHRCRGGQDRGGSRALGRHGRRSSTTPATTWPATPSPTTTTARST